MSKELLINDAVDTFHLHHSKSDTVLFISPVSYKELDLSKINKNVEIIEHIMMPVDQFMVGYRKDFKLDDIRNTDDFIVTY